jgi:hypothetical protein
MAFQMDTSSNPAALGAGQPAARFVDYTNLLRLENPETADTGTALTTFSEGPELSDFRTWAERAHGFEIVAIEEFDAKAEHKRRKAAADALADEMAEADTEAKRILQAAREEAMDIVRDAEIEADNIIAAAARALQAAAPAVDGELAGDQAERAAEGAEAGEPANGAKSKGKGKG